MPALLERDADLAVLRQAVVDASGGSGSVVVVAGEAGIGKSSLVEAWLSAPGADARVLRGWCDDLLTSRTLGPLRDIGHAGGPALAEAVARADTAAVLAALLGELANPLEPTVLAFEDLHWADEATLDVVRYVGRRVPKLPGVLAITFRDDEVGPDHPLRSVLGALPTAAVHRVSPRPLSRAAVAVLTEGTGLDAEEVLAITGGNPFFVTEVVLVGDMVPASVSDAVVARVGRLPLGARRAVELLSVIPGAGDRELVETLVGDLEILVLAEQRGLVVADEGHVRFRHELARRAVLESLPVIARLAHHRTVLDHLLAKGGRPAAILHHAVESGRGEVVAAYGPTAARDAFRAGAYREAVGHHAHVLRYADLLDAAERARVLEEHAWALYTQLRLDEALAAADEAARIREDLVDPAGRVPGLLLQARMRYMTHHPEGAAQTLDLAESLLPDVDDPRLRAEVLVNRLAHRNHTNDHRAVVAEAPAVIAEAARLERPDLLTLAYQYLGWSQAVGGDPEGITTMRTAIATGKAAGVREPLARAYTNAIATLVTLRRWSAVDGLVDEAAAFYDDFDFPAHRYDTLANIALARMYRGSWAEAARILEGIPATDSPGVLEAYVLGAQAMLAVRAGADEAESVLSRAWRVARPSRSGEYIIPVVLPYLEWAWLQGDAGAEDDLVQVACKTSQNTVLQGMVLWRLALLGHAVGSPADVAEPERSSLRGDWDQAARGWEALGMPYEQAIELLGSGDVEATMHALRILDGLGAEPAARIARQRLRDLGVRSVPRGPRGTTRDNPVGLTDRQVEVLALIAEGLTNAEIADRLVVSVRTVDHHVSAVLDKLGVDSRREASQRAVALGV